MVATGRETGQHKALCAGANVITRNFTPSDFRSNYKIYGGNRHVVDRFQATNAIHKARLDLRKDDSSGSITLSQEEQNSWFEGRYDIDVVERPESVYGTPTALGMRFLASAKERFLEYGKGNLDVGCGDGRHALPLLLEEVPVASVDRSPKAIERFFTRCKFFSIPDKLHNAQNADAIEFLKASAVSQFGSITMSNVLYYFTKEQFRAVCNNAHALLIPRGLLFIAVEVAPRLGARDGGRTQFFSLGQQYNYTPEAISELLGLEQGAVSSDEPALGSAQPKKWRLFDDCEMLSQPILRSLSLPGSGRLRSINGTYGRMFLQYEIILQCCKEEGAV
jgi:SAM-dependent methyltransferase